MKEGISGRRAEERTIILGKEQPGGGGNIREGRNVKKEGKKEGRCYLGFGRVGLRLYKDKRRILQCSHVNRADTHDAYA